MRSWSLRVCTELSVARSSLRLGESAGLAGTSLHLSAHPHLLGLYVPLASGGRCTKQPRRPLLVAAWDPWTDRLEL